MSRRDDRDDYDRSRRDEGYREERGPSRPRDAAYGDDRGRGRRPTDDYGDDRGGRRSRDDYDDRGRRDDYDDYDRPRRGGSGGSGLVSAVGIINIVVAGLVLIFGFCLLLGGAVVSTAGDPLFGPGDMMGVGSALRFLGTMAMINGILGILLGGCGISSGIGILMRRSWARTLGMITAGMAALMAVLEIIRIVGGFLRLPSSWPGKGVGITLGIIDFLILLSFALFSFIALAGKSREFR